MASTKSKQDVLIDELLQVCDIANYDRFSDKN